MSLDKRPTNVALRANITERKNSWCLVPGDIVKRWKPTFLVVDSKEATALQREEEMYYVPCAFCNRHVSRIKADGPVEECERYECSEFSRRSR